MSGIILCMSAIRSASIIVPAYREAPNLQRLVERIFAATSAAGITIELIVVDDNSQDGTRAVLESLQKHQPVRLIVRTGPRGLAGAVLEGFRHATHDRFVVLDADLQHPPEMIPTMIDRLDEEDCDFVLGTRYGSGGDVEKGWPAGRRVASRIATALARPLAPLTDPMSGFFAVKRETWAGADALDPVGYKIGLELFVKGRCRRPSEVPIRFGARAAGSSKSGFAVGARYLQHLSRLYRYRFPTLTGILMFLSLVGGGALLLILVRAWFWE